MKIKKLVSMKNCIAALVVGLALSQTTVASSRELSDGATRARLDVRARRLVAPRHAYSWISADTAAMPPSDPQGVWLVTVTPRNCVTGVPIPTAAFEALYTFHNDGTMSAWLQNSTITTTRSPNHGLWKRENGSSGYSFKFVHLRYNLTTGVFIGKQEGGGILVLGESGDEFTTDGSSAMFDANGNPTGTGCSNSAGTRFKLEQ